MKRKTIMLMLAITLAVGANAQVRPMPTKEQHEQARQNPNIFDRAFKKVVDRWNREWDTVYSWFD